MNREGLLFFYAFTLGKKTKIEKSGKGSLNWALVCISHKVPSGYTSLGPNF